MSPPSSIMACDTSDSRCAKRPQRSKRSARVDHRDRQGALRGASAAHVLARDRLHLVRQELGHGLRRLNLTRHLRDLGANHRVLDELLAEGLAGVRPEERLLKAHAGEAERLEDDAHALCGVGE